MHLARQEISIFKTQFKKDPTNRTNQAVFLWHQPT
jgi:hypothetical protein